MYQTWSLVNHAKIEYALALYHEATKQAGKCFTDHENGVKFGASKISSKVWSQMRTDPRFVKRKIFGQNHKTKNVLKQKRKCIRKM